MDKPQIIQPAPIRTTPKGRTTRPAYLCRINYPPLLSDQRCTITTTGNPNDAMTYTSSESIEAVVALLESIGYISVTVVPLDEALSSTTDGPEKWVPEAIAQQEEHIRRQSSCTGINGSHANHRPGLSHSWDLYSTAPGGPKYEACWRCRVTKTDADYQTKLAARATRMEGA